MNTPPIALYVFISILMIGFPYFKIIPSGIGLTPLQELYSIAVMVQGLGAGTTSFPAIQEPRVASAGRTRTELIPSRESCSE